MLRCAGFATLAALTMAVAGVAPARAEGASMLSGEVTSAQEGAMEGVVVSARRDGGNITVSVVTDAQGRYSFPPDRLQAGRYVLSIRAAGFDLDGPGAADLAGAPATVDLRLRGTKNLSRQLTNAEWLMSTRGSDDDKLQLIDCVSCHTLERVVKSTHDADAFAEVLARTHGTRAVDSERRRKLATYLASINLSEAPRWDYPLKTLPRVSGRGTHVVITEYDLPRATIAPQDVVLAGGYAWYSNFAEPYLGRLDPKTGAHKEFPLPQLKRASPTGSLALKRDQDGSLWLGMMDQGALARFDPGTEKFQLFPLAPERNRDDAKFDMLSVDHGVDGRIWVGDAGPSTILRLDRASGQYEDFDPLAMLPGGHADKSISGIAADSGNNLYMTEFQNYVVRLDAKTGAVTYYKAPTPFSGNRLGTMDAEDRFWFAEYRGNKIGMFDTRQETFREWPLPTKFTNPDDVAIGKKGELWAAGMTTDRVVRLDPTTGQAVEYPLPRATNMRHIYVDNTTDPVTVWVGSTHGASIVRIEPLD
jgi:virginiamycin B lyase